MFDATDIVGPEPAYFPRAGNTVDSLRPNSGLKSSERLVTEGLTTKPEPVEVVQEAAKAILQNADKIDEFLAEQGEQLDRAKVLEAATALPVGPAASDKVIEFVKEAPLADVDAPVTQKQFAALKENFNDSMNEVANMLLELQQYNVLLEERITKYNQRGGHRI